MTIDDPVLSSTLQTRAFGRISRYRSRIDAGRVWMLGRTPAEATMVDDGHAAQAQCAGRAIQRRSDLALEFEGNRVRTRRVLTPRGRAICALSWAEGFARPREPAQRSALAIKGLTYVPMGPIVALTTSLPDTPSGYAGADVCARP
jgi:hypothetical protein